MTTVLHKDRVVVVCVCVCADSGDDHSIKTGWWLFVYVSVQTLVMTTVFKTGWWLFVYVSVQTLVMTTILRQGGGYLYPCRLW